MSIPLFTLLITTIFPYTDQNNQSRLKVFIDCSSTWCDMQYIRSEINIVDFMHDYKDADVHILITSQNTGSGGEEYHLIFFGRNDFKNQTDTLRYNTGPNATDFEERDLMLRYIKTGLIPFIARTGSIENVELILKTSGTTSVNVSDSTLTEDPWDAWVIRIGVDGNINADANYNTKYYRGNFSANRITDKTKAGFGGYLGENRSAFEFEENDTTQTFVVKNHNWSVNHYLVKSISDHWSWAYEVKYLQNTFSNNKGRAFIRGSVEYNIFPYKEVNHKLLTLSYGLTARNNHYYDTTIYDQTKETLYGHTASASLSLNQKWGNAYTGIFYHNYFHNWQFYKLGIDLYANIRIAGGLSFYLFAFGALTRDQIFLVKGNATPEEVLARRRQLASGYNYYTSIGLNYRFGSKLNNVVNPRFDRSSSLSED